MWKHETTKIAQTANIDDKERKKGASRASMSNQEAEVDVWNLTLDGQKAQGMAGNVASAESVEDVLLQNPKADEATKWWNPRMKSREEGEEQAVRSEAEGEEKQEEEELNAIMVLEEEEGKRIALCTQLFLLQQESDSSDLLDCQSVADCSQNSEGKWANSRG